MPARDIYHQAVRNALVKDGWTITHDPFRLVWGSRDVFVDIGAERLLAAEKGRQKIAVEVKSFTGASEMADLEQATGQFVLYRVIMQQTDPERTLYLAVPQEIVQDVFREPIGQLLLGNELARVIGSDTMKEEIVEWIPSTITD